MHTGSGGVLGEACSCRIGACAAMIIDIVRKYSEGFTATSGAQSLKHAQYADEVIPMPRMLLALAFVKPVGKSNGMK
jgi:predicted RNA polymerase sigma factor